MKQVQHAAIGLERRKHARPNSW